MEDMSPTPVVKFFQKFKRNSETRNSFFTRFVKSNGDDRASLSFTPLKQHDVIRETNEAVECANGVGNTSKPSSHQAREGKPQICGLHISTPGGMEGLSIDLPQMLPATANISSMAVPDECFRPEQAYPELSGTDQCKAFIFFYTLLGKLSNNEALTELHNTFNLTLTKAAAAERSKLLVRSEFPARKNWFCIEKPYSEATIEAFITNVEQNMSPDPRSITEVFLKAIAIAEKLDNVRHFALTDDSYKCIVVGDLHGQLDDMLTILDKHGLPSEDLVYVFNGDIVDRGAHSVEVLTLVALLMIVHPASTYVNRGNHEDFMMFMRYGLMCECWKKYGSIGVIILRVIHDFCAVLPLITTIEAFEKVAIMHGGISIGMKLSNVQNIDRRKFISLLFPPKECKSSEAKTISDIVWSDPCLQSGHRDNVVRRAGSYFGPNVTQYFCRSHKLDMVVRSHETVNEGYKYAHGGKLVTVFSASNYDNGKATNLGAVMILRKNRRHTFWTFKNAPRTLSNKSRVNDLVIDDMEFRYQRIEAKTHLYEDANKVAHLLFQALDPSNCGYIKKKQMKQICESVYFGNTKWKKKDFEDMLRIFHANENGNVSPDPFKAALMVSMDLLP